MPPLVSLMSLDLHHSSRSTIFCLSICPRCVEITEKKSWSLSALLKSPGQLSTSIEVEGMGLCRHRNLAAPVERLLSPTSVMPRLLYCKAVVAHVSQDFWSHNQ